MRRGRETPTAPAPERVIVVWLPDWPVTAHRRTRAREIGSASVAPDAPIAIMHANRVVACSAAARAAGVRRGQRRRDAQGACPRLELVSHDPERDERAFSPVLAILEELAPGAEPLRPGLAALRARGPVRFYRGEHEAAAALLAALAADGLDARIGIADGVFTAEQAARRAAPAQEDPRTAEENRTRANENPRKAPPHGGSPSERGGRPSGGPAIRIVPRGEAAAFLGPLPVQTLGDDDLALLLARLGVRTLAGFAALDRALVHDRLGAHGVRLQSLAAGSDSRRVAPRTPPPELARAVDLEPPLELAEQVAFSVRQAAEAFCDAAADVGGVVTALRVTIDSDLGGRSERVWQHPTHFDASSVVDRVRWQLQPTSGDEPVLAGGISRVLLEPEQVDDAAAHQPALIGQGPDERAHHAMTRVQSVLGHTGVLIPVLGGGRTLAEREALIPWGDAAAPEHARDRPWPGAPPRPLPSEIFRDLPAARVTGPDGERVDVDERGFLTARPAAIDGRAITLWAGPWPLVERTWDPARARRAHRFQLVDESGSAWLALLEDGAWRLEGRYS